MIQMKRVPSRLEGSFLWDAMMQGAQTEEDGDKEQEAAAGPEAMSVAVLNSRMVEFGIEAEDADRIVRMVDADRRGDIVTRAAFVESFAAAREDSSRAQKGLATSAVPCPEEEPFEDDAFPATELSLHGGAKEKRFQDIEWKRPGLATLNPNPNRNSNPNLGQAH